MTPLVVNLKTLYQIPAWFGVWFLATFVSVFGVRAAADGIYVFAWTPAVAVGGLTGCIQRYIASRPLSYCLPGHRRIPNRLVVVLGSIVSVVAALPWLYHPSSTPRDACWTVVAAAAVGVVLFTMSMVIVFRGKTTWWSIGIIACVWALWLNPQVSLDSFPAAVSCIQTTLFNVPSMIVATSMLILLIMVPRISTDTSVREFCGRFIGSVLAGNYSGKPTSQARHHYWHRHRLKGSDFCQRWIRKRMQNGNAHGRARWGALLVLSPVPPGIAGGGLVAFMVGAAVFAGYAPIVWVWIIVTLSGLTVCFPFRAATLGFPIGRREYFAGTLRIHVLIVAGLTVYGLATLGFTYAVHDAMPRLATRRYAPFPWVFIITPLFTVPLMSMTRLGIVRWRSSQHRGRLVAIVSMLITMASYVGFIRDGASPILIPAIVVVTWSAFITALVRYALRDDWVMQ